MEFMTKKPRLDDSIYTTNREDDLNAICNWTTPENVAIEYHDLTKIIRIKYYELNDARTKVISVLKFIQGTEFIGINFDVPEYCVPALMLGINSCEHAFINVSATSVAHLQCYGYLRIKYLFTQSSIPETKVINQIDIHNQHIKLIKRKDNVDEKKVTRNRYAYAITTSGSTGIPKIIKVPHSSIVPNILDLRNIFNTSKNDKIAQLTGLTFDPSIVEIFLSLSCGSTLFMVSKQLKNNAYSLLNSIFESKVTILQSTPSMVLCKWTNDQLRSTILGKNSELKVLLLGGESFPKLTVLSKIKHRENRSRIFNIYGITEVSCWASINEIDLARLDDLSSDATDVTYLGKPLSKTIFEVRTENDDVVSEGGGILYIGSSSRICSIDDEEIDCTERFIFRNSGDVVTIDDQGRIFYKGRYDSIIKRFGNRLDLRKLEETVLELNFVKDCFAIWDETNQRLYLCFTVMNSNRNVEQESRFNTNVKLHLEKLPSFYRPDKIYLMERFNLTANGKICTKTLIDTCALKYAQEKELTVTAQSIRTIFEDTWKDHVQIINGGFLQLGGNSVMALQIVGALADVLKVEFPVLIGMLLRDEKFETCLKYVLKAACDVLPSDHTVGCNAASDFQSATNEKVQSIPLDQSLDAYHKDSGEWQKCRDRASERVPKVKEPIRKDSVRIEVQSTFDLRKCIDASPTIFHTSSGQTFATVGSHSGIIRTVELIDSNPADYIVDLSNRIQTAVLVLADFKGVVGCYAGIVHCLDLQTGAYYWKFKTNEMVKCTAITCENREYVYVGSYDRYFYCLSAKDGTEIWKIQVSNGFIAATPCIHFSSRTLFFGTGDGTCVALNQTCGTIVWKQNLKDPIFSGPVVSMNERILFCSVSGALTCFDIGNGEEIWKYFVNDNVFSNLIIKVDPVDNVENIILTSRNKNIHCLELRPQATGPVLKYSLRLGLSIVATPHCTDNFIIAAGSDGTLCIIDFSNGEPLTNLKLPDNVFSSPVMHDDRIVVGCRDNNLYILKLLSQDNPSNNSDK